MEGEDGRYGEWGVREREGERKGETEGASERQIRVNIRVCYFRHLFVFLPKRRPSLRSWRGFWEEAEDC